MLLNVESKTSFNFGREPSGHNEQVGIMSIGGGTRGNKGAAAPPDSIIYAFGPPDFYT